MTRARTYRAVLDTNVIIAALKSRNPHSPTVECLTRWANHEFTLLYSDDLLAEYVEKLTALNGLSFLQALRDSQK